MIPRLDRRDGDRHDDADDTDDDGIDAPASRPEPDRVEVDAHRPTDQPASGTIRPSASMVAWRRARLSSAPGTWSRAW